jgi:Calpain family cysteine protease/RTX calcium-binding nonapeptide repeat (4 copies)
MSRRKPAFVPQLTALENREVPAVASTRLFAGAVTVVCDNSPSSVLVYQTSNNVTIRDIMTDRAWTFAANRVGRVDVYGGASADVFTSRGPANAKLVRMFGLGGADTMNGGNGREVMTGNTGADTLKGNGGNDKLNGGVGNDVLVGGDGDDVLNAGAGDNRLIGGAGIDAMNSLSGNDTIIAIDAGTTDTIALGEGTDIVWRDLIEGSTDAVDGMSAEDVINDVDGFDNEGADTTLDGDQIPLPDPLSGDVYERFVNRPLFSDEGPSVFDINQGVLGDCYYLAAIGAATYSDPDVIRARVADFGDGTYGVHLGENYYRVDNRLVVDKPGDQRTAYVSLGEKGSVWATVMEKAFCHHRMQLDSYQSIEGGFSYDVFVEAFQSPDAQQVWFNHDSTDQLTPEQHSAVIIEMMEGGYAPTLGVDFAVDGTGLLSAHQYVVLDYNLNVFGLVESIRVYNPWGIDGVAPTSGDPNDGIITVTLQMLFGGVAGSYEFGTVEPT